MEDDNGASGNGYADDARPQADDGRPEAGSPVAGDDLLSDEQVNSLRGLLDFLSQENNGPAAEDEPRPEAPPLDAPDFHPELPLDGDLSDGLDASDDMDLSADPYLAGEVSLSPDPDVSGNVDLADDLNLPDDVDPDGGPHLSGVLSLSADLDLSGASDLPAAAPEFAPVRLLTVPRPETGEARVDDALSLLDDLTELPVAEHPAVFERVHAQLSEVLSELGSGPLSGPPGRDGG